MYQHLHSAAPAQAYCYSPLAPRGYDIRLPFGERYGPGTSAFVQEIEVWNIVFLTQDFECEDPILDIDIALHAYRTGYFVMSDQAVDETSTAPAGACVRGLFRLPPAQAVARVESLAFLHRLPLYELLGEHWLHTMKARLPKCRQHGDQVTQDHKGPRMDGFAEANALLRQFTSR